MSRLNCKPGDLAFVRCPPGWANRTLEGKFVTVGVDGKCDLQTFISPGEEGWLCEFSMPWISYDGKNVPKCFVLDSWLRPIRPQSDDAIDEMVKLVGIAPMTAAEVLAWSAA